MKQMVSETDMKASHHSSELRQISCIQNCAPFAGRVGVSVLPVKAAMLVGSLSCLSDTPAHLKPTALSVK